MGKKRRSHQFLRRVIMIICLDAFTILFSYLFALWVRFDFSIKRIPERFLSMTFRFVPVVIAVTVALYFWRRLYHSIWRYASLAEAFNIIVVYLILAPFLVLYNRVPVQKLPWSCIFIAYVLTGSFCFAIRFGYRLLRYLSAENAGGRKERQDRVLLIGGGQAARDIIKELQFGEHQNVRVCAVVDDNPIKKGRYMEGVRIVGNRYDIPSVVEEYGINRIIFAISSATPEERRDILNICKDTGCRLQMVPSLAQIVEGEMTVSKLRDVNVIDLLGREEIKVNNDEILEAVQDRVIMVTGGGGSIGSELCRQIAAAAPKQLIIFDIYENNAYDIQQELRHRYPELDLVTLIGSVRNTNRVNDILDVYHPDVIYHAAAHKHVPLMEDSPNEAIKNNVMGTYKLASAAARAGVKKFLLISTDKAVNPTNIMGASKRLCEMIVQMMSRKHPETSFNAVRFGNVLGSNGSVIPLFKKQIAEGGPVTVTDKNIIRYFMTIPEAVSLVLQAGYYAKGGEIFVLDMGKPVRIDDMARNLIKLSGFKPDVDIKIVYTGLRPGEKLYEELLMDEEGMEKTRNKLIYIGHPIEMDDAEFEKQLQLLDQASREESGRIKEIVAEIVPTYHPQRA
ncbi:MAG: polysaccharide biosynthesis protein [Lachnospiraceae bacterium]|nr:polysaccharide biosynthesis protein [Lachnospiraceae bacterium]